MHTIKITRNLLFEYQRTSGKFIRLPNRIESKLFCPNWNALPPAPAPLPALGYELSPSHSRARVRTDTQSATTGDLSLSLSLPLAAASLLTAGALSRVGGYAGAAADERHRMSKRRRPANRTCCDLSECTDVSAPLY